MSKLRDALALIALVVIFGVDKIKRVFKPKGD
jgi:hypothetical protein